MFRDAKGDFDVETILPIIVEIVTGILGGQAVGAVLQQVAMTQLTKIISGELFLAPCLGALRVPIPLQVGHWAASSEMQLAAPAAVRSLPGS